MRSEAVNDAMLEQLRAIARELQERGLWESEPPPPEALASTQPFCIDTLHFPQWVQFVMLPGIESLVQQNQPLPPSASIAPMAEEYFRPTGLPVTRLIALIGELDTLVTENP